VNGEILEAIGSDIPPEVEKLLKIGEVNIQRQMDPPFLLASSSGDVSRFFNKLVNLDSIDLTMSVMDGQKRHTTSKLKSADTELESFGEQLKEFHWVDDAVDMLRYLEHLDTKKTDLHKQYNKLDGVAEKSETLERRIEDASTYAKYEHEIQKIMEAYDSFMAKSNEVGRLCSNLDSVEKSTAEIEEALKYEGLLDNIFDIGEKHRKLKELTTQGDALMGVLGDVDVLKDKLKTVVKYSPDLSDQIDAAVNMVNVKKEQEKLTETLLKVYNEVKRLMVNMEKAEATITSLTEELPDTCPYCGSKNEN
jgi:DNA repair ATPase RecN